MIFDHIRVYMQYQCCIKKNGRESNMYDKFHLHSKGKNNIKNLLAKEMETVWFGLLFFFNGLRHSFAYGVFLDVQQEIH